MLINFDNHEVDVKHQIYDVYLALFKLNISVQRKCSIMTSLFGGDDWSWRVIGITLGAISLLEKNGYKYLKGSVCRAHIISRLTTAKLVYERTDPISIDELFQIYWANDKTVISTKQENGNRVNLPLAIPIDYSLNHFPSGAVVGWKHRKQEVNFLSELHTNYKLGKIKLVDPYNV